MADNFEEVSASLNEIKRLLDSTKQKKSKDAISSEVFTDPRFIELFDSYFKPLIESSTKIGEKLTDKKKLSMFDVLGVSDKIQETKRNALIKEYDKLTDKIRNIAKNVGSGRGYSITEVLGLTKTERGVNRSIVNNAIRRFSTSLNKSAKALSDPAVIMKFIGLKPMKFAEKIETQKPEQVSEIKTKKTTIPEKDIESPVKSKIENLVVIKDSTIKRVADKNPDVSDVDTKSNIQKRKKDKKSVQLDVVSNEPEPSPQKIKNKKGVKSKSPPNADEKDTEGITESTPTKKSGRVKKDTDGDQTKIIKTEDTISDKIDKAREVYNVSIVDISDEVKKYMGKSRGKGGKADDKKKDNTDPDREAYSRAGNALTRNLVIGGGIVLGGISLGISSIATGLFDDGPLKGLKKAVGINSLKIAAHTLNNALIYFQKTIPVVMQAFSTGIFSSIGNKTPKFVKTVGASVMKHSDKALKVMDKIVKKLPIIGALISLGFAIDRFSKGDIQGGLIDIASGVASNIPIVGTAASIGLDLINAQADIASGGVVGTHKKKGWLGKMNTYLGNILNKVILWSLNKLPFGLGAKIAEWRGLDLKGMSLTNDWGGVDGVDPDTATDPRIISARVKISSAKQIKDKHQKAQSDILKGRKVEDLSDEERAEYDKHSSTIERVGKIEEEQKAVLTRTQNVSAPETPDSPTEIEKNKPTATAPEVENAEGREAKVDDQEIEKIKKKEEPKIKADTQYISYEPIIKEDNNTESIEALKSINDSIERMNVNMSKQSNQSSESTMFNISTSNGGNKSDSSMLGFMVETTRDTCYNNRERNRNQLLNYRSIS